MALAVSLEASFSSDGSFDFGATMTGLGASVLGVDLGSEQFDPSVVLAAVADLAPPDLGAVVDLAAQVAGSIEVGGIVDTESLLAPLQDLLAPLGLLTDGIDLTVPTGDGVGLDVLGADVTAGLALLDQGPLEPLLALLRGVLGDLDVAGPTVEVASSVAGVVTLVRLVGGLLAVHTVACRADRHARLVAGMLNAPRATADAALVRDLSASDLAERIAAADLDDTAAVDVLVAEVRAFAAAVRAMGESWTVGLGFGEAAVVALDAPRLAVSFEASLAAVDESQLPAVADLADRLGRLAAPLLATELPDPRSSLDATFDAVVELVAPLHTAIDGIDVSALTDAMTTALTQVTAPVAAVTEVVESVGAGIGAAVREVAAVVEGIDLTPVTDAVDRALAPVMAALDAVDAAVGEAAAVIDAVANGIISGLDEVADAIGEVATAVNAALGALSTRLSAVPFAAVQATLEGGLGSVADLLASAQLTPYFDTANDVIDTTADVIDAVPFGMLPTDVQQEIVDLSRPVKEIDFDAIADRLRGELEAIVDALDTDVLDEVDAAYQAVVEFLASIDPGAAIAAFEEGPFAELRANIDALDPEALLAPVDEALAPVRSLLSGIDLRSSVLDPVSGVFDEIRAGLATLDPAALLATPVAEVDALRNQITDSLALTTWASTLTASRDALVAGLDRIDPAALATAASGGVMDRLRAEEPEGPGPIGQLVATLAQATGLDAEADSWPVVRTWFQVDGRPDVAACLDSAVASLGSTLDAVRSLEPDPVVAAAQAYARRVLQAVQALPGDARLRVEAEPLLVDNAPTVVLAPLIENRTRYLATLEMAAGELGRMAGTGTSQITAVTGGLAIAVRPVTSIADWVRSVLARFGLTEIGRPWPELIADLVTVLGPDRLLPVVSELVEALQAKVVSVVDAALEPVLSTVDAVERAVAVLDLAPIVAELTELHAAVGATIDQVDPAVLLGPTLDRADQLVDRVATFDPLADVRAVITALRSTIDTVFTEAAPSVVFAPVTEIYRTLVELAAGLDVKGLLQPILDALDGLAAQLEVGISDTADALGRLQAALPDHVEDAAASVSGSISGGLSL